MKILNLALALFERHSDVLDVDPNLMEGVAARYEDEVSKTTKLVAAMFEARAGFATHIDGLKDDNRLRNPRLRTTFPSERRLALANRILGYNDELGDLLPKVLEFALKRELAQTELIEERARDREFADAREAREALGVYVEPIDTIDRLFNDYGVNRRHHACLSDEQMRDIAAIMLRVPAATMPIKKSRRLRGEKHDG